MHCEVVDPRARGGQSTCSAEKPHFSRHVDEGSKPAVGRTQPTASGRMLSEAIHVPPQPNRTKKVRSLVDEGAIGELRLLCAASFQLHALRRGENPLGATDRRRRLAHGRRRILLRDGSRPFFGRGEPEKAYAEAWFGPVGHDLVFAGTLRFPDNVDRALRLRHRDARGGTSSRRSATSVRGRSSSTIPGHCKEAGDRASIATRARRAPSRVERGDSYRLELEKT